MVTSRNAVAFVNIHPQKSKWVTAKTILVSPASILVGEWLQRQRHIGAWPLYILFKCDVRHRLHCFVCTDTYLFNFTKGKTDLVNQRWRRTTCLQHQCYDVGCYPWTTKHINTWYSITAPLSTIMYISDMFEDISTVVVEVYIVVCIFIAWFTWMSDTSLLSYLWSWIAVAGFWICSKLSAPPIFMLFSRTITPDQ